MERLATGQISIMNLSGGKTGIRNAELNAEVGLWNRKKKQGKVFDSSTGFKLPNGAVYSPDVAWVKMKTGMHSLKTKKKSSFRFVLTLFVS